jgi:hypothetical protein
MLPQARGAINRNAQAAAVNFAALVGFCPPHRRNVNVAHAAVAAPLDATSGLAFDASATFVARAFSNSVKVI